MAGHWIRCGRLSDGDKVAHCIPQRSIVGKASAAMKADVAHDPEAGAMYGKEDKLEDYSPAVKDAGHPEWEDKLPVTGSRTAKWCAPPTEGSLPGSNDAPHLAINDSSVLELIHSRVSTVAPAAEHSGVRVSPVSPRGPKDAFAGRRSHSVGGNCALCSGFSV